MGSVVGSSPGMQAGRQAGRQVGGSARTYHDPNVMVWIMPLHVLLQRQLFGCPRIARYSLFALRSLEVGLTLSTHLVQ